MARGTCAGCTEIGAAHPLPKAPDARLCGNPQSAWFGAIVTPDHSCAHFSASEEATFHMEQSGECHSPATTEQPATEEEWT